MTCKFEAGKEYRTREGSRGRVYAIDTLVAAAMQQDWTQVLDDDT